MRVLGDLSRLVLGLVFLFAAATKIWDPAGFADALLNYRLLPALWVSPVALILPWLEALCGLALLVGRMRRGALLMIAAMLVSFVLVLSFNLWRGLDVACGCFSSAGGGGTLQALLKDVLFLGLAGLAARDGRPRGEGGGRA